MTGASGVLDLAGARVLAGQWVAPEEGCAQSFLMLPAGLVLCQRADGRPELALEFLFSRSTLDPADSL